MRLTKVLFVLGSLKNHALFWNIGRNSWQNPAPHNWSTCKSIRHSTSTKSFQFFPLPITDIYTINIFEHDVFRVPLDSTNPFFSTLFRCRGLESLQLEDLHWSRGSSSCLQSCRWRLSRRVSSTTFCIRSRESGVYSSFRKRDMLVFPKIGVFPPKWMVKIMEKPIKMDDLGIPWFFFWKHPYGKTWSVYFSLQGTH